MRFWFSRVTGVPSHPYQHQPLSAELQSWDLLCWEFFLLKITSLITDNLLRAPLPAIPVAGYILLGAGTRGSPGTAGSSHCSAAGGSSSASGFSGCGSGGMRHCTSSELMATLSGCSQRFRCSSVLGTAKGHRETRSDRAAREHTGEATGKASTGNSCASAGIPLPTGEVWRGMDSGGRGTSRICHCPKPFPAGGPLKLWLEHVLCSDFSQCEGPAQEPFQPLHT